MMIQASSDSKAGPPTLVDIAFDLQIIICTHLHPSDILALRQTCKTLELATRQRAVWVAVLHRVCLDNYLFLPSFPILDMTDVELEHAAMAPRRWIELCIAFEKKHRDDSGGVALRPGTTRIIEDSFATANDPKLFIVPGGRYMVGCSCDGIFVWDLGYKSSADCKLIASVGPEGGSYSYMVQATPDGMGLIIFSYSNSPSVYEIYPQSETPQLVRIAHLYLDPTRITWASLFPDGVFWYQFYNANSIVFRIWDYRMNYSISFLADVDFSNLNYPFKVIPTKAAIFLLCQEEIFVWAIPPLLPQPPNFLDHNLTRIPALFRIAYPDAIVRDNIAGDANFQTMVHWYYGSSRLYFHIFCKRGSKLHRFEIIIKPNLLDSSLHLINTQLVPDDFCMFEKPRICEDTLVAHWQIDILEHRIYTGLSPGFTAVNSHGGSAAMMLFPGSGYRFCLCAASGRYVHFDNDISGTDISGIVVVDLF